jgi:VRR-NUC domain-containing protein
VSLRSVTPSPALQWSFTESRIRRSRTSATASPLPSDFGSPDYSRRRAKAITKHLSAIGDTNAELLERFDNWLAPSIGLREYLWGHRRESVETARKLIELIPPVILKNVLGYLVLDYWGHYSGWPDLLVYRPNQWFLAEVKSCRDKLNDNQKRWIEDNHRYLRLPFKLVQVRASSETNRRRIISDLARARPPIVT